LLAQGRWFSPGTPASSTSKPGHHDIAEILLKVALNTKNQSINQSIINTLCLFDHVIVRFVDFDGIVDHHYLKLSTHYSDIRTPYNIELVDFRVSEQLII
jgi:hypothetical protein